MHVKDCLRSVLSVGSLQSSKVDLEDEEKRVHEDLLPHHWDNSNIDHMMKKKRRCGKGKGDDRSASGPRESSRSQ